MKVEIELTDDQLQSALLQRLSHDSKSFRYLGMTMEQIYLIKRYYERTTGALASEIKRGADG